jgi:hypothetical protein
MKPILLDMVWPAIYVSESLSKFWFLVIGTIILELFVIKYFLKFSWTKSFIASVVGNCVSGFVGTFVMVWAMLFWHLLADRFVPHATFDIINWVATYVLMCLGSVFLETLTISIIYKEKIKRLFLPMLTGNFLSYAFIAFVMITATDKDPDEVRAEEIKYLPTKQQFILLDSSSLQFDTATIRVSFDKDNKRLNDTKSLNYVMVIPFKKQQENSFQFDLILPNEKYSGGIEENSKNIHFTNLADKYLVLLEQKNPDTSLGWIKPIITDTLIFKRI